MHILRHRDVRQVLTGRERDTLGVIQDAYRAHAEGRAVVPRSSFLRPADSSRDRIIALPALLTGTPQITPDGGAAGIKWIASFPGNLERGLPRASAVIILNSLRTGLPVALIEGSLISAQRTAASAALAAMRLHPPGSQDQVTGMTLFGCGVINSEVLRFMAVAFPALADVTLFDIDSARAERFARACPGVAPGIRVAVAADPERALAAHRLVSIATTASHPHLALSACQAESTILHLSLRDIQPDDVLACQNVVDDADHVCREQTSLHLAAEKTGGRAFIDASIADLVRDGKHLDREPGRTAIFSPFGLGVLDIALAQAVYDIATKHQLATEIEDFDPVTG